MSKKTPEPPAETPTPSAGEPLANGQTVTTVPKPMRPKLSQELQGMAAIDRIMAGMDCWAVEIIYDWFTRKYKIVRPSPEEIARQRLEEFNREDR